MSNEVFKAISDSTRREILQLLRGGGLSVQEIADHFTMSRPAISKHLKILREAGLVGERPDGRQRFYEVEAGPLDDVASWLGEFGPPARVAGDEASRPATARASAARGTGSGRLSRDEFEDQWGDRLRPGAGSLMPPRRQDWRVW